MAVVYQAIFKYDVKKNELFLTQILPDGTQDNSPVDLEDIHQLEKTCQHFNWNKSLNLSIEIGKELFSLLNGDRQTLVRALKKAADYGECLQLHVRLEGPTSNLPFELLYQTNFLVPFNIHLIRRVSDWGCEKTLEAKDRPLKILFMACAPEGLSPVLSFEKEEETIYEVTKELPVEIDIEDTGSLDGLGEQLAQNEYDVVHLSGHADIDKDGVPFFWMEDEEGLPEQVTPSELWDKLNVNQPRLVFLSGCRTGETHQHAAAVSFAHYLVTHHSSTVLGWGLPVSDVSASAAAKCLYFELGRGEYILSATLSTRTNLFKAHRKDWSLLRLFSDGTPINIPLVRRGQRRRPKSRELQYVYLYNSQVKTLERGFIGRRRQIQQGLRCLKKDTKKIGLLLHGTGGLGKSCLAGKFCERLKDYTLIIVHGQLNAVTFGAALKDAFVRGGDEEGLKILDESMEMPDKLRNLCWLAFRKRRYLILLDDFEQNLLGVEEGRPRVSPEAIEILETLLRYVPYSAKMSQLIITSRYTFSLTVDGLDLVERNLKSIGLTSFRGADERKKLAELDQIAEYPDPAIRQQLIDAGRGNPRLMEALNTLLRQLKDLDVVSLVSAVKHKQEEFVQNLVLRRILESQSEAFQTFMRRSAVYRRPVLKEGIGLVRDDLDDWESHINQAVRLSLMEQDCSRMSSVLYWVTPLLRKDIFEELPRQARDECHRSAVSYYKAVLSESSDYAPVKAIELIEHALKAGMDEDAIEEAGRLLPYLRESLAYKEGRSCGVSILQRVSRPNRDDKYSRLLYELGWIYYDLGDPKKAIEYYEQALSIDKQAHGERHSRVAADLSNLGGAWLELGDARKAVEYHEQALTIHKEVYGEGHFSVAADLGNLGAAWLVLGDARKAVEYHEQALTIHKKVYGERHSSVATDLNNLGVAWRGVGDSRKAIQYFDNAISIEKEVYGPRHPRVAAGLSNLGAAWRDLGDPKKAIEYYEQALSIDKEVYGPRHPRVATSLNNLGEVWRDFGDPRKAVEYLEQALPIDRAVYGEKHSSVASTLNNLGGAWRELGDAKKAIEYCEQALSIDKEVHGERHSSVATVLNNLGAAWLDLGDAKKAIEYCEQALSIDKEVYGERHSSVASVLNNLGAASRELGDAWKAIECFEQAISIIKQVYGERHLSAATILSNLGEVWRELGDTKKAIKYFEQAISIIKEVYGERNLIAAAILSNLGAGWHDLGNSTKAIEYLEQALSIYKEVYGEGHPRVAAGLSKLGSAWRELGDAWKAIDCFEEALSIDKKVYGQGDPRVAIDLLNIGTAWWHDLGDASKATEYLQEAYEIFREFYGDEHPRTKIVKEWLDSLFII